MGKRTIERNVQTLSQKRSWISCDIEKFISVHRIDQRTVSQHQEKKVLKELLAAYIIDNTWVPMLSRMNVGVLQAKSDILFICLYTGQGARARRKQGQIRVMLLAL